MIRKDARVVRFNRTGYDEVEINMRLDTHIHKEDIDGIARMTGGRPFKLVTCTRWENDCPAIGVAWIEPAIIYDARDDASFEWRAPSHREIRGAYYKRASS